MARRAESTPPAGGQERCHDVVAWLQVTNARPDLLDDARAFVPAEDWQRSGQVAGSDVLIGVAEPGGLP